MRFRLLYLIIIFNCSLKTVYSQVKKEISLEDVFKERKFSQKTVSGINWMKDGEFYTSLHSDQDSDYIIKYNITTGAAVDTLVNGAKLQSANNLSARIDDYSFSSDERKVLLVTNMENIYRRSFVAEYFIYNLETNGLQKLSEEAPQSYATFSPDGTKVAFVRNNDLYFVDLNDLKEQQVTSSGKSNQIINGSTDWVYEEEFYLTKAFFWSPDSKKLAFYTFDESEVKEYNMQLWGGLYPYDYKFKYPKAGEKNSLVKISIYFLNTKKNQSINIGDNDDVYVPRIGWTQNPEVLSLLKLNRHQNKLEIIHANVGSGNVKVILTEESKTYVDVNDNDKIVYLPNNKSFLRTSEKDGFKHIYHHNINGNLINQVTKGNWEVNDFVGIDVKKNLIYYTSTEVSPLERHLYSINLNGKGKKKLSEKSGVNAVNFSPDFNYYINFHSNIHQPLIIALHKAPSSKLLKVLEDNKALKDALNDYAFGSTEFFTFSSDTVELNGYMIKPADFDSSKKYPVLMYVYGGPGDQRVLKNFYGSRELWHHHLTQKGYIVAVVDNRGTGGRGRDFKHITYMNMGKYEVQDQIEGAKYLGSLPFIDESRIGIWGWSYGGYMSSLALFLGAEYFKVGIAVAPVTNWRFYDTIYTERYLRTPQENPEGYDAFSPLSHVDKLEGAFLLIHGTGDDNVHYQNAIALEESLIEAGKQFHSFHYPNKNHSISGGNTSLHLFRMMTKFIEREL